VSAMADPIELPASDSEDALVDAIAAATASGAPLHLGPGVHFTKRGRRNVIPIGAHGLSPRQKKSLAKHKSRLRAMAARGPLTRQKKQAVQKGGALVTTLLGIALPALISMLANS